MKSLKSSTGAGPKTGNGHGGARKGAGRPLGATIANGAKMPAASSEKMALLALWKAEVGRQFPALVAAQSEVEIAGSGGRRVLAAQDFFQDWYLTALEPGEMVTAVILPKPQAGAHGVYIKHARVAGDYATASVAACVSGQGRIRVVVGACGPVPIRDDDADALLSEDHSESALARAAALLQARADPLDDVRGSADYRRALIPRLLLRAVRQLALQTGAVQ